MNLVDCDCGKSEAIPPAVLLAPLLLAKQTEGLRKIEAAGAQKRNFKTFLGEVKNEKQKRFYTD